jgi:hypothetical protein
MTEAPLTPHAQHNREMWDRDADSYQESHGPQLDEAGGSTTPRASSSTRAS